MVGSVPKSPLLPKAPSAPLHQISATGSVVLVAYLSTRARVYYVCLPMCAVDMLWCAVPDELMRYLWDLPHENEIQ